MLISFPHIFIGRVTKKSTEDKGLYNFDRCLFYLYCTNTGSALRLLWDTLLFALTAYFNWDCCKYCPYLKAETQRPNRWTSEAFWETQTMLGINMFGVFSCVGSFRSRADVVGSNSACKVWGGGQSDVWAIGFSDWQCASESVRCVGGAEYCVRIGFLRFRHSPLSCFAVLARD